VLVIEDLSDADWTKQWDDERVAAVLAALRAVAASPAPPNTASVRETFADLFDRWSRVEQDPEPFLSLGLRDETWLRRALPALLAVPESLFDGDALLHLDVRSDNMCFRDGRAMLVDWNWASFGNPEVDIVGWLPSLAVEGGPAPWEVLPEAGEFAAWVAGVWAAVAGLPPPATAPHVRAIQRAQLAVALDWIDRDLLR
jgi:aminoglycoside phosphotransferase (APT) family kinase protein